MGAKRANPVRTTAGIVGLGTAATHAATDFVGTSGGFMTGPLTSSNQVILRQTSGQSDVYRYTFSIDNNHMLSVLGEQLTATIGEDVPTGIESQWFFDLANQNFILNGNPGDGEKTASITSGIISIWFDSWEGIGEVEWNNVQLMGIFNNGLGSQLETDLWSIYNDGSFSFDNGLIYSDGNGAFYCSHLYGDASHLTGYATNLRVQWAQFLVGPTPLILTVPTDGESRSLDLEMDINVSPIFGSGTVVQTIRTAQASWTNRNATQWNGRDLMTVFNPGSGSFDNFPSEGGLGPPYYGNAMVFDIRWPTPIKTAVYNQNTYFRYRWVPSRGGSPTDWVAGMIGGQSC